MKSLKLREGGSIPTIGLGTWLSEPDEVYRAIRHAIELGYRHIDGAWIYLNEAEVGRSIRDAIKAGDVTREDLWLTTKLWNDHHRSDHVPAALERSLGLLGLDYVDLYLIHWPVAHKHGVTRPKLGSEFESLQDIPLSETWDAMVRLRSTDGVRHVGVSNFSVSKIQNVTEAVGFAPEVNQVELHPFHAQNELLEYLRAQQIVATAYAPLGSAGRPDTMRSDSEVSLLGHPVVAEIAEKHQATAAQVLIAWAVARNTAVIPKSVRPQRIAENLQGAELRLEDPQIAELNALDRKARYVTGDFWCPPGSPYTLESLWG